MAANKSDLLEKEIVPEEEARKYASEIGAVFKLTSACNTTGIEELFKSIGCKYLDPNYKDDDDNSGNNQPKAGQSGNTGGTIKLGENDPNDGKKKKKCC